MKFDKTLFNISVREALYFFVFGLILITPFIYLASLLFGYPFSSYFLSSKVIVPIMTLIPVNIVFIYNRSGLLEISDIEDMDSVKRELEVKLAKIGFAPSEQTFDSIRFDRKTKTGRALNRIFNEYTDVHFNEQTISVYSKRNILMRLQMHLNQLK